MDFGSYHLFTLGYSGKTLTQVESIIDSVSIDLIIDVRRSPYSRLPGFKKQELQRHFGDRYEHIQALGNAINTVKPPQLINEEEGLSLLELRLKEHNRICLLCLEKPATQCHRLYISEKLAIRVDTIFTITHL